MAKKIANKKTKVVIQAKDGSIVDGAKYTDLIGMCVDYIPQGGFSSDDIMNSVRIKTAMRSAKRDITFEDADFKVLQGYVARTKWTTNHEDVAEFIEYIKDFK